MTTREKIKVDRNSSVRVPLGEEAGPASAERRAPTAGRSDFGNDPVDAAFHREGGTGPKSSLQTFQNLEDP